MNELDSYIQYFCMTQKESAVKTNVKLCFLVRFRSKLFKLGENSKVGYLYVQYFLHMLNLPSFVASWTGMVHLKWEEVWNASWPCKQHSHALTAATMFLSYLSLMLRQKYVNKTPSLHWAPLHNLRFQQAGSN